ncbi:MAG: membrane protein insertion efficiency factor YidD [Pseudomonadota bacterium]
MLSRFALFAIFIYQRWLSPHKGFRCAYSVLHGGTGCSGFVKACIREHGVWRAIPMARGRFRQCTAAYTILRARSHKDRDKEDRCSRYDCTAGCDYSICCKGKSGNLDGADLPCDCSF